MTGPCEHGGPYCIWGTITRRLFDSPIDYQLLKENSAHGVHRIGLNNVVLKYFSNDCLLRCSYYDASPLDVFAVTSNSFISTDLHRLHDQR
jgi:hypothetical protein